MTIELEPGSSRTLQVLAAVLLLAAVGFVVARTALARRRGEDAGQAAAGALRAVGPPLFLALFGLAVLSIMVGLFGILFLLIVIGWLGGDAELAGTALVVVVAGVVIVLLTVIGAVVWGIARLLRLIRARQ